MRSLLPLALFALSAHALTAPSTNAAPEAPREIIGNYRFLGIFCGDVAVQTDVGGTINLEISSTNVVMSSNSGIYANDQFLSCTERTESKIVSSEGDLLVVQPGNSVTQCLDNEGNVQQSVKANEGVERIHYTKQDRKLFLMFEGDTMPVCTSGVPLVFSYELSPMHE